MGEAVFVISKGVGGSGKCVCSYSFYCLHLIEIECRIFCLSVRCHRYDGILTVERGRLYAVRRMVDCRGCGTNATDDGGYYANKKRQTQGGRLVCCSWGEGVHSMNTADYKRSGRGWDKWH